jgi:AcrR family transcriptional regulator
MPAVARKPSRPSARTSTRTRVPARERIVAAALDLFSERGTAATSVRDVAERAEVTVPGLYYHFASKADLIQEVLQNRDTEGVGEPPADADLPSDVESRIRVRAQYEFERLVADTGFLRLMQREAVLGDPDAKQVGEQMREFWRGRWCEILAGAVDVSPTVDLDAAADAVVTYLWGVFVDFLSRDDQSGANRIPSFAALIAPGLRAAPR